MFLNEKVLLIITGVRKYRASKAKPDWCSLDTFLIKYKKNASN